MFAIVALREADPPSPEAIDVFMAQDFPLIEGPHATFVWRGEADTVFLRHFIYGLPSELPFTRIDGTDLWFCMVEVPAKSRIEYKLIVVRDGNREWIRDPLNRRLAHDPFGANSACYGEGYERPLWIEPDPEVRPGTLSEHTIHLTPFGEPRQITIYKPARFVESSRYPLLIVHDGGDYLRFAAMKTILDNLIHRDEVQPLIACFSHPGNRLDEYPDDVRHVEFIADVLLPKLEKHLPVYGTPRSRCLMGASFGGVAALSVAWRRPGVFGKLLLQSGSFAFTDIGTHTRGAAFDPVVAFMNKFRSDPGKPSQQVFVSCGMYETLIYENRSIVPLLQGMGMDVRYRWARDGHNWENWRDRQREALSWLFPGHLWMTYE
jgi:enterochelin esterase-like enzyme